MLSKSVYVIYMYVYARTIIRNIQCEIVSYSHASVRTPTYTNNRIFRAAIKLYIVSYIYTFTTSRIYNYVQRK